MPDLLVRDIDAKTYARMKRIARMRGQLLAQTAREALAEQFKPSKLAEQFKPSKKKSGQRSTGFAKVSAPSRATQPPTSGNCATMVAIVAGAADARSVGS
jgi:hypothetical protein